MDEETQGGVDESMRLVIVGAEILLEADLNPEFHAWLTGFLDSRLESDDDRDRMGLPPRRRNPNVLPFPAIPPVT